MSDQQDASPIHPVVAVQQQLNDAMSITARMYDTHMRMLAILCQRNGGTARINHNEAMDLPPGFDVEMNQDEDGVTLRYVSPKPPTPKTPGLVTLDGKPLNGGG